LKTNLRKLMKKSYIVKLAESINALRHNTVNYALNVSKDTIIIVDFSENV